MCLLVLLYRVTEDALVVAANREEYYNRGGDPPGYHASFAGPEDRLTPLACYHASAAGGFIGGIDPAQGGTWLGVNAHGVLVAVTNRRKSQLPAVPRSRGLLVRDLLGLPSAAAAAEQAVRQLQTGAYAGCNFLCADHQDAVVIHAGDWLRVRPLPPGVHVLSNKDVNDPGDTRVVYALDWLARQRLSKTSEALAVLRALCISQAPASAPMCFQLDQRGTVSSSLLAIRRNLADSLYWHAQGAPDRTAYTDVSHLFGSLASTR